MTAPGAGLTAQAGNNINLNAYNITTTGGTVTLIANDNSNSTATGSGIITSSPGYGNITTSGGNIALSGFGVTVDVLNTSGPSAGSYPNGGGHIGTALEEGGGQARIDRGRRGRCGQGARGRMKRRWIFTDEHGDRVRRLGALQPRIGLFSGSSGLQLRLGLVHIRHRSASALVEVFRQLERGRIILDGFIEQHLRSIRTAQGKIVGGQFRVQ